jgi:hypothetical protein
LGSVDRMISSTCRHCSTSPTALSGSGSPNSPLASTCRPWRSASSWSSRCWAWAVASSALMEVLPSTAMAPSGLANPSRSRPPGPEGGYWAPAHGTSSGPPECAYGSLDAVPRLAASGWRGRGSCAPRSPRRWSSALLIATVSGDGVKPVAAPAELRGSRRSLAKTGSPRPPFAVCSTSPAHGHSGRGWPTALVTGRAQASRGRAPLQAAPRLSAPGARLPRHPRSHRRIRAPHPRACSFQR